MKQKCYEWPALSKLRNRPAVKRAIKEAKRATE